MCGTVLSTINPSSSVQYASPELSTAEPLYWGLTLSAWVKISAVTALFLGIFFQSNLVRLWNKTNPMYGEANWGHAICVPLIGLYYLFVHREELLKARVRTSWTGLVVLLGGLFVFAYGIWPGQNDFIKDLGMVITLFGIVQLLCGPEVMKIAWFPIVFLVCAIPWPGLVYSKVAGPLQDLAAKVAVWVLQLTGVHAGNAGTKIFIEGQNGEPRTLNVAEACAGLKSLMTFITIGAAVAFLSARPLWQKLTITASAVPIAIFCNVARVSGQGLLDHYVSKSLSESFAHQFVGMIMVIPAFFLILGVGWALDHLFIEEVDDEEMLARQKKTPKIIARAVPAEALVMPAPSVGKATAVAAKSTTARPATTATRPAAPAARPPAVPPPSNPQARPATALPRPNMIRTTRVPPRSGPSKGQA